jgi:hypothetical protein
MKLFSRFVNHYFSASPKIVSFAFFLICLFIDFPSVFYLKVNSFATYFYYDSNGQKQIATFYQIESSDFSFTPLGRFIMIFFGLFLNLSLLVIVGVILNITSLLKYKSHARQRREEAERLEMSSIHNRPTTSRELEQIKQKERTERQIEKNMLYMALTLSSLSIFSRCIFILSFAYYFFQKYTSSTSYTFMINYSIYTLGPSSALFIFYSFNKMFRDEVKKKFLTKFFTRI